MYIWRCIFAQAFSYTFFGTVEIVIIYLVNGSVLRFEVVHCQANNAIRLLLTKLSFFFTVTDCEIFMKRRCHPSKERKSHLLLLFPVVFFFFICISSPSHYNGSKSQTSPVRETFHLYFMFLRILGAEIEKAIEWGEKESEHLTHHRCQTSLYFFETLQLFFCSFLNNNEAERGKKKVPEFVSHLFFSRSFCSTLFPQVLYQWFL